MNSLDFLLPGEKPEIDISIWFRGGPSPWDEIVSFTQDVYETAEDVFEFGYFSARVAFAAPFVFGAAALFSITDQLHALMNLDYSY